VKSISPNLVRQRDVEHTRSLFARLVASGYDDGNVARWGRVPLVTDVGWAGAAPDAARRGLGGWIALLAAGEAVEAAGLRPAPTAEERAALVALGIVDDDGATLAPRATVLPWRGLVVASPPG
jgi:hypothetical protein